MPIIPLALLAAAVAYLLAREGSGTGASVTAENRGQARWTEARKLDSLHPELRPKIVRILAQLRREFGVLSTS